MIRNATIDDRDAIAAIDRLSHSGNKPAGVAERWVESYLTRAHDQYHVFVYEKDGQVIGNIGWEVHGGFARAVPVIELQKFAVHPDHRGQGIGTGLLLESFEHMKQWIAGAHPAAQSFVVVVWTVNGNEKALATYKKICIDGIMGEREMYDGKSEVMLRGTYSLAT